MKFVIDRFEKDYAVIVLEDKTIINIPRLVIPKEAREGDVLEIKIDKKETERIKNEIEDLINDLFE